MGPTTEPCGRPKLAVIGSDNSPAISTRMGDQKGVKCWKVSETVA